MASLVFGLLGGFVDSLLTYGGFKWLNVHRASDGAWILDFGSFTNLVTGAAAGFVSFGFNFGQQGLDTPFNLGTSVWSFVVGLGGAEFLRTWRERAKLQRANKNLLDSVENLLPPGPSE